MEFHSVEALATLPEERSYYDLAVFASGCEKRSTYFASNFDKEVARKILVLGFSDGLDVLSRPENDLFFEDWAGRVQLLTAEDDESVLFSVLDEIVADANDRDIKILVDYSVMTRTWYAAILTWARFSHIHKNITIDFVYVSGTYMSEFSPLAISDIVSLPGFEGTSGGFRRTSAIFGLGYDKYATLAVYDRLEPDRVYCCIAQRTRDDLSSQKALKENEVIVDSAVRTIRLPLTDVESTFRLLADQITAMERLTHIVVVPMGPKTHVLATLLVALRMPWVTCLHARGRRAVPVQVEPDGNMSISRVTFCEASASADSSNRR